MRKSFLKRVAIANEIKISVEDVYTNDMQFQQFVTHILDLVYKFSSKFKLSHQEMLNILVRNLEKEI